VTGPRRFLRLGRRSRELSSPVIAHDPTVAKIAWLMRDPLAQDLRCAGALGPERMKDRVALDGAFDLVDGIFAHRGGPWRPRQIAVPETARRLGISFKPHARRCSRFRRERKGDRATIPNLVFGGPENPLRVAQILC
jgi:hypothetical protein